MARVEERATELVDALERADVAAARTVVPRRYWEWLDDFLLPGGGWSVTEELAGRPRAISATREIDEHSARIEMHGPDGRAFLTVRFDVAGHLIGFSVAPDEREGIATIVISCPEERVEAVRAFYEVLIPPSVRHRPRLHFDEGNAYVPPRWPHPEHPQQMHLDVRVADLDAAEALILAGGGALLADAGDHRTYADPIGHPFCLYPSTWTTGLWRVVIDAPDPVALATFYAGLVGEDSVPPLAFQRAKPYRAPRWPDPAHPTQMHFDLGVDRRDPFVETIERLGGVRLPPEGGSCPVFADPAGHPFCLCLKGE